MALYALLKFGNNELGLYDRSYKLITVRNSFARKAEGFFADTVCRCSNISVVLQTPDKSDLFLYDWFISGSSFSGCIEMEEIQEDCELHRRLVKFEDARCHLICESFDSSLKRHPLTRLEFIPLEVDTEEIKVGA